VLAQCPRNQLGFSLWVLEHPGEDRGGEEGVIQLGASWAEAMGLRWPSGPVLAPVLLFAVDAYEVSWCHG